LPRTEPFQGLDELYAELAEADVVNLPDAAPDGRDRDLASLLAFAVFFTRRLKRVTFPEDLDWGNPGFTVEDGKVTMPITWARVAREDDLPRVIQEEGARAQPTGEAPVLALDILDTDAQEYRFTHALYGDPVMLAFRVRPPRTEESRIPEARAAGWTPTLKEHNLIPGRSLFIPDDRLGLYLTEPKAEHLRGVLLLLPTGTFSLNLNPFARDADPDHQHWLQWGRGGEASEWQDVLMVEDEDRELDP
jgi:hypothetical protein